MSDAPKLPGFMHGVVHEVPKISHGNYPTIPYRTNSDAPYSPRSAKQEGMKQLPAKAGVTRVPRAKSKGKVGQAKASRRGK